MSQELCDATSVFELIAQKYWPQPTNVDQYSNNDEEISDDEIIRNATFLEGLTFQDLLNNENPLKDGDISSNDYAFCSVLVSVGASFDQFNRLIRQYRFRDKFDKNKSYLKRTYDKCRNLGPEDAVGISRLTVTCENGVFVPLTVEPNVICFDDIEAEAVDWLWYPYIPLGKLTLMQGDPGCGKTYIASAIASMVSNGSAFPGTLEEREPATVLFQNGEDGATDTLKPRLELAGANHKNIFIIDESKKQLTLKDLGRLRRVFEDICPQLIIIDPLQLYLGADVDMHRANEIRPVMAGLARLAEEFNTAVIVVMHMNKGSGQKAMYRGLGTIDLPAIARSILLVGENLNAPGERLMVQIKNSLAPKGKAQAFSLIPDFGLRWLGESDSIEDDILQPKKEFNEDSALGEAMKLIETVLLDGPKLAPALEQELKAAGISKRTFERARSMLHNQKKIHVKKSPLGWVWEKQQLNS